MSPPTSIRRWHPCSCATGSRCTRRRFPTDSSRWRIRWETSEFDGRAGCELLLLSVPAGLLICCSSLVSPLSEEDSRHGLHWLGCLTGSRRARSLLKHLLQTEVARNEVLVDHGQKLPRCFHPGQAVIGDLQVRMEVTEVFYLGG